MTHSHSLFGSLCTHRWTRACSLSLQARSFWLAVRAGSVHCMHVFVKVQCSTFSSTLEDESVSLLRADWFGSNDKTWYCTVRNFRQRKISSKATVRQFVRNLFSSNVGRRLLLFGRSVVVLLLIVYLHIHEYFWSHTCSFVKNLVRNLI